MSTDHSGSWEQSVPQWKKDLILRRRAVGRVLPAGSGSVQLTCPSVVAALRCPDSCATSDFRIKTCSGEREQAATRKNMRLVEQVNISGDSLGAGLLPNFEKNSKFENCSSCGFSIMGKEKKLSKKKNTGAIEKKCECSSNDGDSCDSDSSEELKYGPGIVSKLKSRYLSLTLRESQGRVRPTLPYMRRATSLENILDGPDDKSEEPRPRYKKNSNAVSTVNVTDRCRSITRGNKELMKRAGSVETLIRYERGKGTSQFISRNYENGAEEEGINRRKIFRSSVSSSFEEKELPPPDVVKHTLKIFENSANLNKSSPLGKMGGGVKTMNGASVKKPTVFPKTVAKAKGIGAHVKTPSENPVAPKPSETRFHEKVKMTNGSGPEKNITNVNSQKPEKPRRTVVHSEPLRNGQNEEPNVGPDSLDVPDSEHKPKTGSREEVAPDLADVSDINTVLNNNSNNNFKGNENNNEQKSNTSPEVGSDCAKSFTESPDQIRSISPVLVRAPPCILSSEINASSPTQHMKQLGVVRPIVTYKGSGSSPRYSPNKIHSGLTEREIEKNLINAAKSIEPPVTKVIVSLKKSPEECIFPAGKESRHEDTKVASVWDSRKPNTMVFNFSNRKTVPDYIENDGLVLRKEKPKRGEPGIIFFEAGGGDALTDLDLDDFSDPPSPCDFIFEGDNILINGKSNIQSKPKPRKMRIQFNDDATTLFEYPSEASLLEDIDAMNAEAEDIGKSSLGNLNHSTGLSNPFRCGSLASYTPSKVTLSTDFQLGVTKTTPTVPTPPPASQEASQPPETDDECLRPADESTTVTWSSETATDLLF